MRVMTLSILIAGATFGLMGEDTICTGALTGTHDNVIVPDGATCAISNATIEGNVLVKTGSAVTISGPTYIDGNVQSEGSRSVRLAGRGVTVNGDVQIKKAFETSVMQPGTQVLGNFQYEENSGFLQSFGAVVSGDFQVFKNTGGAQLINNTIRQNLQCKENVPAPRGRGNKAGSKEDQCAAL